MSAKLTIVSASAGTGKTYRLTHTLSGAISEGVRPEAVLATTFTRRAASDLQSRARLVLLEEGRPDEAARLSAARIGTVNSVCGRIAAEFALEAGISPDIRVLEEAESEAAFREALAGALAGAETELNGLARRLGFEPKELSGLFQKIVDAARANALGADGIRESGRRSRESLLAIFPDPATGDLDAPLAAAVRAASKALDAANDGVKKSEDAAALLRSVLNRAPAELAWSDWVKLSKLDPSAKLRAAVEPLKTAASAHLRHPRLRADLERWTTLVFDVAARALEKFQTWKRERRLMDFVDQEALVLSLLDRQDVRARIAEDLELLLVDEFQDTSPIQLALFLKLLELAPRAEWVGDPKQSIFAFRGTDPALMDAALAGLPGGREPLEKSWRSRPELVALVREMFVGAFPSLKQSTTARKDAAGLAPALQFWKLAAKNAGEDAHAVAAGVKALFDRGDRIEEAVTKVVRAARPGDVAVLCRTNRDCAAIADALEGLGIRAAISRPGLRSTPEGVLAIAGLTRLLDPADALATAEIVALTDDDPEPESWLADRLTHLAKGQPGESWAADRPALLALARLKPLVAHASPSELLDAVLEVLDIRRRALAWGRGDARLANVEALRAAARTYENGALARGTAASGAGLVEHFRRQAADETDAQAEGIGPGAVTVLTVHKSKGLEWPIVVLADVDADLKDRVWDVEVRDDRAKPDLAAPLAQRWIRSWTWPWGQQGKGIGIEESAGLQAEEAASLKRAAAEDLRLLYVAMTRARDVLVLAGRQKKDGVATRWIERVSPEFEFPEDEGPGTFQFGAAKVRAWTGTFSPLPPAKRGPEKHVRPPRPATLPDFPPARIPASSGHPAPAPARVVSVTELGPRLKVPSGVDDATVGNAVHAVFAADDPASKQRTALAAATLARFEVAIDAASLLAALDRLRAELEKRFRTTSVKREWPLELRVGEQVVAGWADMVLECADGWVLVDHKTFPGGRDKWPTKALEYAPQLQAYAEALEKATGRPVIARLVHFPIAGALLDLQPHR